MTTFAAVLGHARIKALLQDALRRSRLPGALLFTGPEGVGKRTLALAAARALLCDARSGEACNACPPCNRTAKGLHPDLFVLEPEGASVKSIKIEPVRDLVREIVARPFEGPARAFIVDDAHLITEQAQNALLKSLEEPPATSHVMLVTAAPQALLTTIRSRCQHLRLGGLPASLLEGYLRERQGTPPEEARLRAALAGGSLSAALEFEAGTYQAMRDALLVLVEKLPRLGPLERMEASQDFDERKEDLPEELTALRALLRDVAALHAGSPPSSLLNADVAARIEALAASPLGPRAAGLAEVVGETREALRVNANRLLSMDVLIDRLS
ncbi:MAG TPA: DNA polymerase III subunit delta' [Vicinamibacteria bacterium]|nr:DNA polymerase III subunit delta' [Vicinamibacteria bacterium]